MRRLLSIIVSLVTAISFAQQPVELPCGPRRCSQLQWTNRRGAGNASSFCHECHASHPDGLPPGKAEWNGYYHVSRRRVSWTGHGWRGGMIWPPRFCGQGITYIVLKYRMPNGHWEVPRIRRRTSHSHGTSTCQRMECQSLQSRINGSLCGRALTATPSPPTTIRKHVRTFRYYFIRWLR